MTAPFVAHSRTSRAAAEQIGPVAGSQKRAIVAALRIFGPQTDEQLTAHTGLNPSSARPRRIELLRDGVIEAAGEGRTSSGRRAQLWRLSPDPNQGRLL